MKKLILSLFFTVGIILLPSPAFSAYTTSEEQYREVLLELIETLQQQILYLQGLSSVQTNVQEIGSSSYLIGDSVDVTNLYSLDRPSDVGLVLNSTHKKYFTRVFELFPEKYDEKLRQLAVFADDEYGYDAYVETIPPNHKYWLYAVNEDVVDDVTSNSSTELIVHELAHLVEYEEIIGVPKPANQTCNSYFRHSGCPVENSYLKQFVNKFWTEEDLSRAGSFFNSNDSYELAYDYYQINQDKYVSGYSAINPEEDFAETFMFYILDFPTKRGEVRQKIDFMASYPELRLLKAEILKNK
ncbi:hypothetical protein KC850_03240 [Candidatus Kaiserbacteria bacterium]|nr:hypothetical protein [Candidatus Kaiserbacteria bacterium]